MSLLDTASLILTPNGYKADKLYSVKPTNGDGDMVVSRNTTATRVDSAGLIAPVAINVPRLDYPPLGGCPSILIEPLRTNLVFPSATLTTQTRTVTAVAHTLSFYGTGSIVLSGVHIATLTGTGANNRVTLTFTPTAGSLILTVAGTVTNAQLEAGANATSYIPTTTATVTRNADVISKTGISSLIGQTEGTIFIDAQITNFADAAQSFITISDGTIFNRVEFRKGSASQIILEGAASTGTFPGFTLSSVTVGRYKIAVAYKTGDTALFINGVQVGTTSLNAFAFTSLTNIVVGANATGSTRFLNDRINLATVFQTRLTNAQLATLTTI